MTTLDTLRPIHLGSDATDEDVEQFRDWARELMTRDGLDEFTAMDRLWNNGDYLQAATDLGLRPEVGPLE